MINLCVPISGSGLEKQQLKTCGQTLLRNSVLTWWVWEAKRFSHLWVFIWRVWLGIPKFSRSSQSSCCSPKAAYPNHCSHAAHAEISKYILPCRHGSGCVFTWPMRHRTCQFPKESWPILLGRSAMSAPFKIKNVLLVRSARWPSDRLCSPLYNVIQRIVLLPTWHLTWGFFNSFFPVRIHYLQGIPHSRSTVILTCPGYIKVSFLPFFFSLFSFCSLLFFNLVLIVLIQF